MTARFTLLFILVNYIQSSTITLNYIGVEINYNEFELSDSMVNFTVKFPIPTELLNEKVWLGIGFNSDQPKMDKANVIVCKSSANNTFSVEHYFNNGFSPLLFDLSNPSIGIGNSSMRSQNNTLTCSFSRMNFVRNASNYYDITKSDPYVLVAYGKISANNDLTYHGENNRFVSLKRISFSNKPISTSSPIIVSSSISNANTIALQSTTNRPTQSSTSQPLVTSSGSSSEENRLQLSSAIINYKYGLVESNFRLSFELPDTLRSRNAFWIGFGFNSVEDMDDASVVVCKYNYSNFTIQHYYNSEENTPIILDPTNPTIGLKNQYFSLNNNILTCSFTRTNAISSNQSNPKSTNDNSLRYFDLSTSNPYVLFAFGGMKSSDGSIEYHGPNQRDITQTPVQINTELTTVTSAQTTPSSNNNMIFYGSYKIGSFKLNWIDTQSFTDFTLESSSSSNNAYIAIGFSNDQQMGDDQVIHCSYSNNLISVAHAYNTGKVRPQLLDQNDKSVGLTNTNAKFDNQNFVCSFRRSKTITNVRNYFDLNRKYYLLFAKGPVSADGNIQFHTERVYSSTQINLQSNTTLDDQANNSSAKVKAHGSLMVISWVLIASNGILMPRYYKYLLPNVRWFNLQFWFNMHRPLMCCVPILSFIALMVILADVNWKWIDMKENSLSFTHSIFGIVTIGFSFLQIPMGFLRPSLTSKRRYVFNFFHRLTGLSAYAFSIIALFIGVCIPRTHIDRNGWILMLSWTLYSLFLPISIEFMEQFASKTKTDKYELTNSNEAVAESSVKSQRKLEIVKSILLIFHLIISIAITIGLIYVIAIP